MIPPDWAGEDVGIVRCGTCGGRGCRYCDQIGAYVGIFPRVICGTCQGDGCRYCKQRGSVWIGNIK
ncbi:MAG: hypothetical protein KAT52_06770 [Desulfobacterales bacterium]|nr:hypothetical protein [Desulfobacterales bacterium]